MASKKKAAPKSAQVELPSVLDLDFDSISFEDLETIADGTGLGLDDLAPGGKPSPRGLAALVWLQLRKTNPGLQFDSVMKMPLSRVMPDEVRPARPTMPRGSKS